MAFHTFTVFRGLPTGITASTTTRPLLPTTVLLKTTHSGLCGTDIHQKTASIALGHEGIGTVLEVGSSVTTLKPGDTVGWGFMHSSCGHCRQCLLGEDVYCADRETYMYSSTDQGSLGTHAVWDEKMLFKVPDNLEARHAAPLMCAGATVYTALAAREHGVRPGDTVGVVGLGGLGHLAVQFAKRMGCRVVVFSGGEGKRRDAVGFGADGYYALAGRKDWSDLREGDKVDHLLVTASGMPDWALLLEAVNWHGKVYPLGVYMEDFKMPSLTMMTRGVSIVGTFVANRGMTIEMLRVAAEAGVKPMIEEFDMSKEGIEKAFDRLESGEIRYRAVLKN